MYSVTRAAGSVLLACSCASVAHAQSADQEIIGAVGSEATVAPGDQVTYTVTLRNHGPDAAVNGGLNISFPTQVTLQPITPPPGFSCGILGQAASCTTPALAAGTTTVFTIIAQVQPYLTNVAGGSFRLDFGPSGTTPDPDYGNNFASVTTHWDSPESDLSASVVDSPDPVGPGQDVTFSVNVIASGPDDAPSVTFNVFNNGSLRFGSATVPPAFSCALPAVGATPSFTCTSTELAPGTYPFSVVLRADPQVLGILDSTHLTNFGVTPRGSFDPDWSNNEETEVTAYVTPDADMQVEVVDDPDPAELGGVFDYLIVVRNQGPDPAPGAMLDVYNPNTLRFVSMDAPPAFSCDLPAVGAAPGVHCTTASLESGASAAFVLRVRASASSYPPGGGLAQTSFSVGSTVQDPTFANNSVTETTTLVPSLLFKDGFED